MKRSEIVATPLDPSLGDIPEPGTAHRWGQLLMGLVCMAMVANLQYGWTLFVNPMDAKFHWGRAAIQVAFSIFVITTLMAGKRASGQVLEASLVGSGRRNPWHSRHSA